MTLRFLPIVVAATAVLGCDRDDNIASESAEAPRPSVAIANDQRAAEIAGRDIEPAQGELIPELLQGRWALTPTDCTAAGGEGLLVVTADTLRFHESVARPVADVDTSADSVSGTFSFSGEGQRWTRYQALELQDGKLIRTETEPATSYSYVRC